MKDTELTELTYEHELCSSCLQACYRCTRSKQQNIRQEGAVQRSVWLGR